MCQTLTPHSLGRRAAPARATAPSRCGRSGRCEPPDRAAGMIAQEGDRDARGVAEQTARRSYGKLVAFLAQRMRDVAAAEDALAEAFAVALTDGPAQGVPDKPEAWLLTVARRKAIDGARRQRRGQDAAGLLRLVA